MNQYFNVKNIRVRYDTQTQQLLISVKKEVSEENTHVETLVSTGEKLIYTLQTNGIESVYDYKSVGGSASLAEDAQNGRFIVFDFSQVVNHLLGGTFKTHDRFSLEELKQYEKKLNSKTLDMFDNIYRVGKNGYAGLKFLEPYQLLVGRAGTILFEGKEAGFAEYYTLDKKRRIVQILPADAECPIETIYYGPSKIGRRIETHEDAFEKDVFIRSFYLEMFHEPGTEMFWQFTPEALVYNLEHSKNSEYGD